MAKKQIIDIDAEFDGLEFDEKAINISTARKGQPSNHKGKTRPWAGKPRENKSVEEHTEETKTRISNTKNSKSEIEKQSISKKISSSKKGQVSWNKGIPMSNETKEIQRAQRLGKPGKSIKPIITELGIFVSVKEGIAFHKQAGIPNAEKKLTKNLKDETNGYRYITKEEYIMLTGKEI